MSGVSALIGARREVAAPLCCSPCEGTGRSQQSAAWNRAGQNSTMLASWPQNSGLQTVTNKFPSFVSYPVYSTLLQQSEQKQQAYFEEFWNHLEAP